MKKIFKVFGWMIFLSIIYLLTSCDEPQIRSVTANNTKEQIVTADLKRDTVYKTNNLILIRLTSHVYQHISFLNTNSFGRVNCNGMLIVNDNQAIIFDTPTDDVSAEELIKYATDNLQSKIIAVIPTHFHEDCIGGIGAFEKHNIQSYASAKTKQKLAEKRNIYSARMKSFDDSLTLNIGDKKIFVNYFGEGHTKDNVVGYFPADNVLFGGCLIKETGASKGNLEDANTDAWPATVLNCKQHFTDAKIVIPGHGKSGGTELLDYTINLFR
ncbi:MAG: subclass B1 metallo-beta-lactamase [Ginsengibacter sp.]